MKSTFVHEYYLIAFVTDTLCMGLSWALRVQLILLMLLSLQTFSNFLAVKVD